MKRLSQQSADVWVDDLVAAEVPAADREYARPQPERSASAASQHGVGTRRAGRAKRLRVAGNPIKFTGEAEAELGYPPLLGADNHEILRSLLGFGDEELAELERAGVFGKATGAASARKAG